VSPRVPLIAASLGMKRPAVVVVTLCPSSVVCCSLVPCRERQNVWSMLGRCWCGANQCTDKGRRNRDFGCLTFHLISPCPLPQLGRHGGFRLSDLATCYRLLRRVTRSARPTSRSLMRAAKQFRRPTPAAPAAAASSGTVYGPGSGAPPYAFNVPGQRYALAPWEWHAAPGPNRRGNMCITHTDPLRGYGYQATCK
jgi:hypothetical protein